jgi:diguanylate cyclase (GGDEF)-like protein
MRAIAPELQDLLGVAVAVLGPDGTLLESNAGFRRLAGPAARQCFAQPSFAELLAATPGVQGELHKGELKLRDAGGNVHSLQGSIWRSALGICLMAERVPSPQRAAAPEERQVLVEASLTDALTGTGNRARLDQALTMEISRVQRTNLPLSAFMAGIDHLAAINELHGRAGGDAVLARFGFLLRLLSRPTDIPARSAEDWFVVLMPHTNLRQATIVAERVRKALSADHVEPLTEPATASFGVAEFVSGENAGTFLARIEAAAREAKSAGRNKVNASEPK